MIDTACDGEQLIKGEFGGLGVGEGHGIVSELCSSDDLKIAGIGCWGVDGDQGWL